MDVNRRLEMALQAVRYTAEDTADAAVRIAAMDALIAAAEEKKAAITAELAAKVEALGG